MERPLPRLQRPVRTSPEFLTGFEVFARRHSSLIEARSFHARLVDLLRVEFTSLGAFLEALAEFDRREHFRALGTPISSRTSTRG